MMTPCQFKVLLHCHVSNETYDRVGYPAVDEAFKFLLDAGMIEPLDDTMYITTAKGAFWLEYVLNTPFPVAEFTIPERKSK